MKRLLLATIMLLVIAAFLSISGCGETDPAQAPYGSAIEILSDADAVALSYECDQDWDVPDPCFETFREYCISICETNAVAGEFPDNASRSLFDSCQGDPSQCAALVCEDYSKWIDTCEIPTNKAVVQNYLRSAIGRCGFQPYLLAAMVTGTSLSTGSTSTMPLSDVEVRWTINGGELYKPEDVPGAIAPLANPYYDETDERGLSEVKYRLPLPNRCGTTASYQVGASIGVASAVISFDVSVAASDTTDTETTE